MALTKAHNRMIDGSASNVKDFGAVADGTTNDAQAIYNAINSGAGDVFIPKGTYHIDASVLTVDNNLDDISQAEGHGSYTVLPATNLFIPIVDKKFMTIKCAEGVKFLVKENTSGFGIYGCTGVSFIGGEFEMQGSTYTNEPSAIIVTRCNTTEIDGVMVDNFHRGLFVYRCITSGITRSTVKDCNYFGHYVSSVADQTIHGVLKPSGRNINYITKSHGHDCANANFFADHAMVEGCISYHVGFGSDDAHPQVSNHFTNQFGHVTFRNNIADQGGNIETGYTANASNPGNVYSSGFCTGFGMGGTLGQTVRNCRVEDNVIRGCKTGISFGSCDNVIVSGNEIDAYWLNGIDCKAGNFEGVIIKDNYFGTLNASSTAAAAYGDSHKGAISIDGDSADSPFQGIYIDANIFDTGSTTTIKTVGTAGEGLYINDTNILAEGTTGRSDITLSAISGDSPFFAKIKETVRSVSGGTSGSPVLITPEDSGKLIVGIDYIQFPDIASAAGAADYLHYDVAVAGSGTMTLLGDSGNFIYRVEGSNSVNTTSATSGITLSGAMFVKVVVGEAGYNVYYYNTN